MERSGVEMRVFLRCKLKILSYSFEGLLNWAHKDTFIFLILNLQVLASYTFTEGTSWLGNIQMLVWPIHGVLFVVRWLRHSHSGFLSKRILSYNSFDLVIRTTLGVKFLLFEIPIAHLLLRLLGRKSNFCNNKAMHKASYEFYYRLYF